MQPVITIFNKQAFDDGDSISHVNEDELHIRSVGRADLSGKAFFKPYSSASNAGSSRPFKKHQTSHDDSDQMTPQRDELKPDNFQSATNFKRKMISLDDTIKEEPGNAEEMSQRQINFNRSKLQPELTTKDDQDVKIVDPKSPRITAFPNISTKTTYVAPNYKTSKEQIP